jgi:hypothetical protein
MTYSAPQDEVQLSGLHGAAIRKEIGEQLRACRDQELTETPHLVMLVKRLRDEPLRIQRDLSA